MKKENILNYSFYILFAIFFIWNIYLVKNNPSYEMYGKISQERQDEHINKLHNILDNLKEYEGEVSFKDIAQRADYLLLAIILEDKSMLKTRNELYNIANKVKKNSAYYSLLALAHTADYLTTGNVASFVNAEHDIQHILNKDLASY